MDDALRPTGLLATADAEAAKLIAETLADLPLSLHTAPGAASARQMLARAAPDLLLVDLALPDDPLGLCRDFAADPISAPVVVAIGSAAGGPRLAEALAAGADAFLGRPLQPADLRAQVQAALRDRQRRREAETLAAVGRDLLAQTSLERILQTLSERARELLAADVAGVALHRPDGGVRVAAVAGWGAERLRGIEIPPGRGLSALAEREGSAVITTDYPHDRRLRSPAAPLLEELGLRTVGAAPLRAAEEMLGTLLFGLRLGVPVQPQQLRLLERLADLAAIAIRHTQLHEEVRARERWLQSVLDHIPQAVLVYRAPDGDLVAANPAAQDLLGYVASPGPGMQAWRERYRLTTLDGAPIPAPELPIVRALAGERRAYEALLHRPDGVVVHLSSEAAPIRDEAGRVVGAVTVVQDVGPLRAEQRRQQELLAELARLLEQTRRDAETRQRLLRQLNHRVRNNLALVTALLSLELHSAPLKPLDEVLVTIIDRIKSIAAVHSALARSDFASADAAEIAREVAANAEARAPAPGLRVAVGVDSAPLLLNPKQATALGIIINELVSNSLKHAFRGRQQGLVTVTLTAREDEITLEVRDDGVGLPGNLDAGSAGGTGLRIVRTLGERDLHGRVDLRGSAEGTVARVTFRRQDAPELLDEGV